MPPRKRAQSPPTPDSTGPVEPPETDTDQSPEGDVPSQDAPGQTGEKPTPRRSDLQAAEQPCPECFPGGWPEQAWAVGCTHGTWTHT